MTKKIRIHLADDHQVLIDGMRFLLHTIPDFDVVGFSLDGSQLFDEVVANKTDILVIDISMPVKDGIEVLKEFKEKGFPCKVIVLSSYDDVKIIKEVMKLGSSAYLTKQCAGENIVEAIHTVLNGEEFFCKSVREKIFTTATKDNPKLNIQQTAENSILTGRELEIITLISLEFSGKEISEKLFISTNTVETHRKNIMKKLDLKNSISLVKYALKNNIIKS
jgi:DNA-binding NarL/FixJ family response regulator